MTIDLRQFHQTFFEESVEGLAVLEAELLQLERTLNAADAAVDAEQLNRIFRVVHSIKGGSATFGFTAVAEFAHTYESLLDDIRSLRRALTPIIAGLLLRAVDALGELIAAARADRPPNAGDIESIRQELDAMLSSPAMPARPTATERPTTPVATGWHIEFQPQPMFFRSGNDPLRILRELSALGPLTITLDVSHLPAWDGFDPHSCYLGWHIELGAPVAHATIGEVFAWVTDDCALTIAPRAPALPATGGNGKTDEAGQGSIRVATPKVDALVDMVGELVITQTMLNGLADGFTPESLPRLRAGLAQLERHTRELQDCVLGIRMLPIGFVFSRLPRMVRDISQQLGKRVELKLSGERTELDKTIIERISDPLVHLVRNSIDHGIETAAERAAAGKPEVGTVRLDAYHKGGNVVVEIEDDGRGLDRDRILATARARGLVAAEASLEPAQIDELIFAAGFSTAVEVNDLSGRGVGLDVVRNNIRSLAGGVEVTSIPGRGTRFTIRLPLTLAIVDGMCVEVGQQVYILPLTWIAQCVRLTAADVSQPVGGPAVVALRREYLPLLRLHEIFGLPSGTTELSQGIVVVVEADGKKAALFVDELRGQQQVVIKSLETHYGKLDGISAATILGDGTVALILDIAALVRRAYGATANGLVHGRGPMRPPQRGESYGSASPTQH